MEPSTTPIPTAAHHVAQTWQNAALATGPADRGRAEAAARDAYRAAALPAPSRFIWCLSPWAALEHVRRLIDDGHTPLVDVVRRKVLNRSLSVARAPLWEQVNDVDRVKAFGDFHSFFEWEGYYGEQRYDGMDERYNLMERPYRCSPVTAGERSALQPVLGAVRQAYDAVLGPVWGAIGHPVTGAYAMRAAWYWDDDHGFVDRDDEARAVVRYSLPEINDMYFDAAWFYYPDPVVLAAIDTYRSALGTAPDSGWEGCRAVALSSGPWWPFGDVAVMSERPTALRLDDQGRLHGDEMPAVEWPDGKHLRARHGDVTP